MPNGAGAAGAAASIINATKASGVVVQVPPDEFVTIVRRSEHPLVVHAISKVLKTKHKYLTSYKGLAFYTKADEPLFFRMELELIEAKKIWVPDL